MEPFVSVIIPTYGGNASLQRSVESVLSQEYGSYEIIVIDDNNPDSLARAETERLMEKFGDNARVVYIKHEKNKNGAAARNTGVKAAKGEYIAFLDDDDIFLPAKLRQQACFMEQHLDYGAVYCWRRQGGKLIKSGLEGDLSKEILTLEFTPCTPAVMMRTSCYNELGGFDERFRRHQDFEFLLRFFEKYKIGVVKEPLVEIIGNSVNNQPQGKKAVEVKKQFLSTFDDKIRRIDVAEHGFMKRVWAVHYAQLAVTLSVHGHFLMLVKMYVQEGHKGGRMFWKRYLKRIAEIFAYQFTKRKRK